VVKKNCWQTSQRYDNPFVAPVRWAMIFIFEVEVIFQTVIFCLARHLKFMTIDGRMF